jgi:cytochrome c553
VRTFGQEKKKQDGRLGSTTKRHTQWRCITLGGGVFSALTLTVLSGLAVAGDLGKSDTRQAVQLKKELGDYQRGRIFAEKLDCAMCHGPAGHGQRPGWPKLAGQHEQYLLNALQDLADGSRPHVVMTLYASQLSVGAMHDLALYYAYQTDRPGVEDPARCPPM